MKPRIFLSVILLAVATLANAGSSSLASVLPGSWQLSDGSLANYAPIGNREFTSLVSGVNFPYSTIHAFTGEDVVQITNLHGIVAVDARNHATFTLRGHGLDADGMAVVSIKVTGDKTLNRDGTLDVTNHYVCLNSVCFQIADALEERIVNEAAP
jgi:hypothetical protein